MIFNYKKFFAILLFLILGFLLVAQEVTENNANSQGNSTAESSASSLDFVNWFTEKPLYHNVTVQTKAKNYSNFDLVTLSLAIQQQTNMKELIVTSGFEAHREQNDITFDVIYAPTLWDIFNVGARLINHFSFNYADYFEYDLLVGLYASYQPWNWVKVSLSGFYHQKNSYIYNIYPYAGALISNCPAFSLVFDFYPIERLTINASISSFDFFRYYLFFAPEYKIEAIVQVTSRLKLFISGDAQFVDFFTLSANFSSLTASIGAIWKF